MYGIDFGTTYTVVSYKKNGEICYLNLNDSPLIPTSMHGQSNLKRLILEQAGDISKNLEETLIDFFTYIYQQIAIKLGDTQEYKNCIITVPVRFNDMARNVIKKVALFCKFYVVKLLSEPIAAAFAALANSSKNGYYLVYDLGGGTFDATLLSLYDDVYHVEKVDGLADFGGVDIDLALAKEHNISLQAAEEMKKTLFLPHLDSLLQKTYNIILNLAEDLEIQGIILAGGSSYLKNIEDYLGAYFNVLKLQELQLIVSAGACIYGYDFLERQKFLIDVTPFDLGIEVMDNKMSVIIPRNTPIPAMHTETFAPVNSKVSLNVLQGLSNKASDCAIIKHLSFVTNEPFEVSFILDSDGILFVKINNEMLVIDNVFQSSI